jgi:hypothetical protein
VHRAIHRVSFVLLIVQLFLAADRMKHLLSLKAQSGILCPDLRRVAVRVQTVEQDSLDNT